MILILEVWIEFDDVGVIEFVVDTKFICELVLHLVLFYCWLENFLNGAEKSSCFMHAYVHISKFTRTNTFS